MKKIDNKLIIFSTAVMLFSLTLVSQIRTVNSPNNGVAGNSSAFIDASSNIGVNNSASLGKGLIFPQTDLTNFTAFRSVGAVGLPNNYRNYFDGMIVYNTATGQSSIGDVSVVPGFYYYSNPELNTVAVLWTDPDDNLVREHYIMVDEEDEQWRDFVKEIPYEKINERTEVRHEQFREQFRESFREFMTREQESTIEAQEAQTAAQTLAVEALKNQTKLDYESWKKDLEDKATSQAEVSATQAEELKTALKLDYESWKQTIEDKNPDNILLLDTNIPKDSIFDMFFGSYDEQNAKQKEQLFKLKLKIFEQDNVKNAKKDDRLKNAKTFIRKAKSPMEVLLGYMVFSDAAELNMNEEERFEVDGVYIPLK